MDKYTQTSLQLFGNSSFDDLLSSKGIRKLSIRLNPRMMKSWNVKISNLTGSRVLNIPSFMEKAPDEIKNALIEWAILPLCKFGKTKKKIQPLRSRLENIIHQYISSQLFVTQKTSTINPQSLQFKTKGNRYDLTKVFNKINSQYFEDKIKAIVRWGSYSSTTSYQTTKTGTNGSKFYLITIAGVYNHPDVPEFAIEAVMYHEMLHIKIPPYKKNGRNVIHGPEYKMAERKFQFYNEWHQWEKLYLFNLAKQMRSKHKRKF